MPGLWCKMNESPKQKAGGMCKINDSVGKHINQNRIRANPNQRQAPRPEVPYIYYQVKNAQQQTTQSPGKHHKGTGPHIFIYWENQVPQQTDADKDDPCEQQGKAFA